MADTAKKTEADKTDGDQEPDSKTSENLTSGFDRESHKRAFGEVHYFTFADGTSAKVWQNDGDSHVNVQLRDHAGRGTSATTTESITVNAANKIIDDAGQKAADRVASRDSK